MKKFIVIALAVVMMVSALAVFAACGTNYEGEYSYDTQHGKYGVGVIVTVTSDRRISKIVLKSDEETGWVRTSTGWGEGEGKYGVNSPSDLGYEGAEAAYEGWFEEVFYGKTIEEVMAYKATANSTDQFTGETKDGARPAYNLTGATQSAARIILAVQNALEKVPAAE